MVSEIPLNPSIKILHYLFLKETHAYDRLLLKFELTSCYMYVNVQSITILLQALILNNLVICYYFQILM